MICVRSIKHSRVRNIRSLQYVLCLWVDIVYKIRQGLYT